MAGGTLFWVVLLGTVREVLQFAQDEQADDKTIAAIEAYQARYGVQS